MRIEEPQLSSVEWEQRVGVQFRTLRISAGFDQTTLADRAGISIGALRNLERGSGSSLKTVVQVARALGRDAWLGTLAPVAAVSPLDAVRARTAPRSRVYRPRRPNPDREQR